MPTGMPTSTQPRSKESPMFVRNSYDVYKLTIQEERVLKRSDGIWRKNLTMYVVVETISSVANDTGQRRTAGNRSWSERIEMEISLNNSVATMDRNVLHLIQQ